MRRCDDAEIPRGVVRQHIGDERQSTAVYMPKPHSRITIPTAAVEITGTGDHEHPTGVDDQLDDIDKAGRRSQLPGNGPADRRHCQSARAIAVGLIQPNSEWSCVAWTAYITASLPVVTSGFKSRSSPIVVTIIFTSDVSLGGYGVATTEASFTPGEVIGDSLAFAGPIVFTPTSSTSKLTANVKGDVNVTTGDFQAKSTDVTGTGAVLESPGH